MTAENTQPAAESAQRKSYMAALSLAEQILSDTLALPTDCTVTVRSFAPDEPQIRFYFHRNAPGLRQFRDDQMLTERMETREDGSVYIEATREINGMHVEAWTLLPAEADAAVAA